MNADHSTRREAEAGVTAPLTGSFSACFEPHGKEVLGISTPFHLAQSRVSRSGDQPQGPVRV